MPAHPPAGESSQAPGAAQTRPAAPASPASPPPLVSPAPPSFDQVGGAPRGLSPLPPAPGVRPPRRWSGAALALVGGLVAVLVIGIVVTASVVLIAHTRSAEPTSTAEAAPSGAPVPQGPAGTPQPTATGTPGDPAAAGAQAQGPTTAAPTHRPSPTTAATARSGPKPIASWPLGSTSAALGTDATGAHPATAKNVTRGTGHGGSGVFNGTSSQLTTSGPVLDTAAGASFTVSAWVYLTKNTFFATAVSQDGGVNSAFFLQYSSADKRWAFARVRANATNSAGIRALSSSPAPLNAWTHLVGVFTAGTGTLRLYVDGVAQRTATDPTPFAANGPLAIGRARFNGKPTDWFPGQISDVKAFDYALTAAQVKQV